jgi:hypothetical protein
VTPALDRDLDAVTKFFGLKKSKKLPKVLLNRKAIAMPSTGA